MSEHELDDALHEQITELTDAGNECLDNDDINAAIVNFHKALALVPEPKTDWEAALWIYTALGDCYFLLDRLDDAFAHMAQAVRCPGGLGNGFVHLRLGQCFFERDNLPKAADEMARAYMAEGPEIFEGEDPKYFAFLRTKMRGI